MPLAANLFSEPNSISVHANVFAKKNPRHLSGLIPNIKRYWRGRNHYVAQPQRVLILIRYTSYSKIKYHAINTLKILRSRNFSSRTTLGDKFWKYLAFTPASQIFGDCLIIFPKKCPLTWAGKIQSTYEIGGDEFNIVRRTIKVKLLISGSVLLLEVVNITSAWSVNTGQVLLRSLTEMGSTVYMWSSTELRTWPLTVRVHVIKSTIWIRLWAASFSSMSRK